MQFIYALGLILIIPTKALAHDGEHITYVWYQDPFVIISLLVAILSVGMLLYAGIRKHPAYTVVSISVLLLAIVTGVSSFNQNTSSEDESLLVTSFGAGQAVTLYKSASCGCCSGHAKALEEAGFVVTIEETEDLASIKETHKIPSDGESCHTSIIGNYVVEGHVPLEAIEKLLSEQPDIAGIGLAGMPIGTPGMPGKKRAPYEVYQLSETGEMSSYLTI